MEEENEKCGEERIGHLCRQRRRRRNASYMVMHSYTLYSRRAELVNRHVQHVPSSTSHSPSLPPLVPPLQTSRAGIQ